MVSFSDIAIFILATTTRNGRHPQSYSTYYESRITPISLTWGKLFPLTFFVFGTNQFDFQFLSDNCRLKESFPHQIGSDRRFLRPSSPQQPQVDRYTLFDCPVSTVPSDQFSDYYNTQPNNQSFQALYIGNCTGEYFGSGPTCRCQESMRYFLHHTTRFEGVPWFMFIDDDIYLRPYVFIRLMDKLQRNHSSSNVPVGIIAATKSAGVKNIKLKLDNGTYVPLPSQCVNLLSSSFFYAQPAILSRSALQQMRSMLDMNGLLTLQKLWGGSHDSVLGLALWVHRIHLISLATSYGGTALTTDFIQSMKRLTAKQTKWRNSQLDCVMFHRVLNFRFPARGTKKATSGGSDQSLTVWKQYVSQFHVAEFVGEDVLYKVSNSSTMATFHGNKRMNDEALSEKIFRELIVHVPESTVTLSPFALAHPEFPHRYADFHPRFCSFLSK